MVRNIHILFCVAVEIYYAYISSDDDDHAYWYTITNTAHEVISYIATVSCCSAYFTY